MHKQPSTCIYIPVFSLGFAQPKWWAPYHRRSRPATKLAWVTFGSAIMLPVTHLSLAIDAQLTTDNTSHSQNTERYCVIKIKHFFIMPKSASSEIFLFNAKERKINVMFQQNWQEYNNHFYLLAGLPKYALLNFYPCIERVQLYRNYNWDLYWYFHLLNFGLLYVFD